MSLSVHTSPVKYTESSLPSNFTDAILHIFQQFGDKLALIDPDTRTELRFKDLQIHIDRIVANLLSKGYCQGNRIGTVIGNSIEFLLFVLACLNINIVVVPINPASKQGEIQKYKTECQLDCLLNEEDLKELCYINLKTDLKVPEGSNGLALIFFSSGTTGPPKAICHSHRSLVAQLCQTLSMGNSETFPRVTTEDVLHGILPYFHFGGLMTVFVMLSAGATVVINNKWNEDHFLQVLKDYKVTIINIVPPILQYLAYHPSLNPSEIETLKRIYVGAAACDPNLMLKVKERLGVEIIQLFGMTEAGLALLMTPTNCDRLDIVGVPLPGVEIRIGEKSELWVKAPTLMEGYVNSSDRFLDQEGYFATGDLATVSSDGLFSITGRKKDTFKVRGWQVNPWEIEETIKKLPGIVDCTVIGCPHPVDGTRPKAFFVGTADPQIVLDHVKCELISYKQLTEAVRVDCLPRTASGKIMRHELH